MSSGEIRDLIRSLWSNFCLIHYNVRRGNVCKALDLKFPPLPGGHTCGVNRPWNSDVGRPHFPSLFFTFYFSSTGVPSEPRLPVSGHTGDPPPLLRSFPESYDCALGIWKSLLFDIRYANETL